MKLEYWNIDFTEEHSFSDNDRKSKPTGSYNICLNMRITANEKPSDIDILEIIRANVNNHIQALEDKKDV